MSEKIVTRFAPSPTGLFHVGSARTALFSFLFARKNGGEFKIRIEDTDKERSKEEYVQNFMESLEWLGIEHDGEIDIQSRHIERHQDVLKKMIDDGFAYEAEESQSGKGKVIRFKNPNKEIVFDDIVRGEIKFNTTDLKDFVIAKNISEPLFHLAVVVDDADLGVTHIIRGEDHISNTPRQILIREAMGVPAPKYAHIPLILGPDRSKLSKRHGTTSVTQYRDRGYLSSAFVNYMALLGWNPGNDREIFTLKDLVTEFDLSKVQKGGAIFSEEKLNWVNKEHIKKMTEEEKTAYFTENLPAETKKIKNNGIKLSDFITIVLERNDTIEDIKKSFSEGEFDYTNAEITYDAEKLLWKKNPDMKDTASILEKNISLLTDVSEKNFTHDKIKETLWEFAEERGKGEVLWPIRVALSGKDKSPDPFTLASLLGKKTTIERLTKAKKLLLS